MTLGKEPRNGPKHIWELKMKGTLLHYWVKKVI